MPLWVQVILASAAVVTAVGVLWTRAWKPAATLTTEIAEWVPVLRDATEQLKDVPDSFLILKQIIAQFRTDSGSSLRDVVDRLEQAAIDSRDAIEAMRVEDAERRLTFAAGQEASRMLAAEDRVQIATLLSELRRVNAKVDDAAGAAAGVAADLEAGHVRAEEHDADVPGAAADAAVIRPTETP